MSVLLEGVSLAPGEENYVEILAVVDHANCLFHAGFHARFEQELKIVSRCGQQDLSRARDSCCKGRGFCPSCLGRRMAQGSVNLLDHVLPAVPLRQFVLTVPYPLRQRLAYDGQLLGGACRVFTDSVQAWYRRTMKERGVLAGRSGAVTAVQRTSSDLKLNPHFHAIFIDGVFTRTASETPVFHQLPRLSTDEVADLLQVVRVRVLRYLHRRGAIDDTVGDLTCVPGDLAERDPALAALAASAIAGLPPAGPEWRQRPPIPLPGRAGVEICAPLSVAEAGFSLHAATCAGAADERARRALVKYVLRPPIANERLELRPNDLVRILLKKPFRDGTWAIDLDPLSLLARLAASVPPPRFHCIRYTGVLAPASRWRAHVVPPLPAPVPSMVPGEPASLPAIIIEAKRRPLTHRCGFVPWAQLLRKTFAIDVETCPNCNGRMKLLAQITEAHNIARYLEHLGLPIQSPPLSPARAPPYWKATVLRRKGQPQREMFAEDAA